MGNEPLWGNVGSELDRMFPTESGFGSHFSNLGFWGGGDALKQALAAQMEQEQGNRQARTAQTIANTKAGSEQTQTMANLLKALYGDIPLAWAGLNNQQEVARIKGENDLLRMMHGTMSREQIAKQQAEANLKGHEISAQAQRDAAQIRSQGQALSAREPTEMQIAQKTLEIKKERPDAVAKLSDSAISELAREELVRGRVKGKLDMRANPPTPKGTDTQMQVKGARASVDPNDPYLAGYANEGGEVSLPDNPMFSLSTMGMPLPQRKDAAMMERFPIPSAADLYQEWGPRETQPPPNYTPAGPMAKFASKPGGTEMTRRMYAPPDDLANPGQGGQVMNDPRTAARSQGLQNLTEPLTSGPMPTPQSRFSKENPAAWEGLMSSMGYEPPDPSMRQMGGGEDVLRGKTTKESLMGSPALANLLLGPLGPIVNKYITGRYNQRNESPTLDLLPLITMGIAGGTAGMSGAVARPSGQLLLNRGSWANTEPLQLPRGQAPGLPGRGPQGALPSAGNQGRITPNVWDMPPGGQQGALPPGGGPVDLQPRVPQGIPRATPMDLGNVRPMGAAPQTQYPQLPPGLTSKGAIPGDMWSMLKRLYDLRTTGVF